MATPIWIVSAAATRGTRTPSAKAMPPASSANAETYAQKRGGRMPMRAMPCVQPARPGPPHTPRTFCAPCAPMTRPITARTRAKARSVLMTVVGKVISDPAQLRLPSTNARHARTYSRAKLLSERAFAQSAGGQAARYARAAHVDRSRRDLRQRLRTRKRVLSRRVGGRDHRARRADRLSHRGAAAERARAGREARAGRAGPGGAGKQRHLLRGG